MTSVDRTRLNCGNIWRTSETTDWFSHMNLTKWHIIMLHSVTCRSGFHFVLRKKIGKTSQIETKGEVKAAKFRAWGKEKVREMVKN